MYGGGKVWCRLESIALMGEADLMSILVTGAAGFIGSGVVKALQNRDTSVIPTDYRKDYSRLSVLVPNAHELPFMEGDITEAEVMDSIAKEHRIKRIVEKEGS